MITPVIFSVAPMLNVTDRHCRVLYRLLSRRARLYTEMRVTGGVLYGAREDFLAFDASEHPLALQLGGSEPAALARCAKLAAAAGYDEVNLNVGCPSHRVKHGQFGACLMAKPALVADCVAAMRDAAAIPVTVKTRIGIDARDSYAHLADFVARVRAGGCEHFIVHARKAWLRGLSPKQNRNVPPLQYARVYQLKKDFPDVAFSINGGVTSLQQARRHLQKVDGVMLGREVARDPWLLTRVDREIFNARESFNQSRAQVVHAYLDYAERQLARGARLHHLSRRLLPLFHQCPGAKLWRRYLSEHAAQKGAGLEVIERALKLTADAPREQPRARPVQAACGMAMQ